MTRIFILAIVAATVSVAQATYVWKNTSAGDSRCVMTGCTYENAITNKVSFGIWVKDLDLTQGAGHVTTLGGTAHVNELTSSRRGFSLVYQKTADGMRLGITLLGDDAQGNRVTKYVRMSSPEAADMSWATDGKWHFLMMTADCEAKVARLYRDGVCIVEKDIGDLATFASQRCFQFAGGMSANASDTASPTRESYGASTVVTFAEVSLYDRALTADEVAALATRRADPLHRNLVGYWPCNESSGSARNWALAAARRTDGSFVLGKPYYVSYIDSPDMPPFEHPAGKYVVTPEMAGEYGYTPPEGTAADSIGCPATNLVAAFNGLAANQTLVLLPGVYYPGTALTNTKSQITLAGHNPSDSRPAREVVFINGAENQSLQFFWDEGANLKPTIRGLTFCDGRRGLWFKGSGAFHVFDSAFTNLTAGGPGAAIYSWTRNKAVISNCLFKACTAEGNGGAVYTIQNAVRNQDDYLTITHCTFEDCLATGASNNSINGGGIYSDRHNEIYDCAFRNCRAASSVTSSGGGALYAGGCSTIRRCTFGGECRAITTGSGGRYGAVMNLDGPVLVEDCAITGLTATDASSYGTIHCTSYGAITVSRLVCTNNVAMAPLFFFEGCTRPSTIRQCLVARGAGSGVPGSFVTGHNSGLVTVENCTVDLGKVCTTSATSNHTVFVNCLLGGSFVTTAKHLAYVTNCVVTAADGWTDGANVWTRTDLGVQDASSGDYTLSLHASARDRGLLLDWMDGQSTDLAGNPRLVNRMGVAYAADARPDLGCYEAQGIAPGFLLIFR